MRTTTNSPVSGRVVLLAVLLATVLTACGGGGGPAPAMGVGADESDPQSILLAHLYAAAQRYYGTPTRVELLADPWAALDSGEVSVVPGLTGELLQRFAPGSVARSAEHVYRDMVGVLPEGVAAGDYATAASDAPAAAVTERTAEAWDSRELSALVNNCATVRTGVADDTRGAGPPAALGRRCTLPIPREFANSAMLFDALKAGEVTVAWTTTADPDVPDGVVLLADGTPQLIRAENVVPLYRRNELAAQQVVALNEVAGVLDTAALKQLRGKVADGADPQAVADGWLAENPIGR